MQLSAFGTSLIILTQIIHSLPAHEKEPLEQARKRAKESLLNYCDKLEGGVQLHAMIEKTWRNVLYLFQTLEECKWWGEYVQQPSHNIGSKDHLKVLSALHVSLQTRYPKPEDRCRFYKEVFAKAQLAAPALKERAIKLLGKHTHTRLQQVKRKQLPSATYGC